MFNNFLDSLDIVQSNAPVNTSMQLNSGGYQQRTKSGSQHHGQNNAKMQAQNQAALRQFQNNTVQGEVPGGKRNKQLVATSYNMAPTQLAQQQMGVNVGAHNSHSYAAMRMSQQAFSSNSNVNNSANMVGGYSSNLGTSNALLN